MPFTGDSFAHLFDWEKDPQRQEKIVNARLEAEFDGVDTGLSAAAARITAVEAGAADDSITNAKLANMAQSTIKGRAVGAGTGDPTDLTATQATAILDTFTSLLKGLVPASGGSATTFLNGAGAFTTPTAGAVLQVLQNTYATNANLTVQIPLDDTTPTSSEGTEVLSQAITTASASNKVLCIVYLMGSPAAAAEWNAALFRGTTCIQPASQWVSSANRIATMAFTFLDAPGSAAAHTYSVRVGPTAAHILRLNGNSLARIFGGTATCTLIVAEVT